MGKAPPQIEFQHSVKAASDEIFLLKDWRKIPRGKIDEQIAAQLL